MIADGVFPSPAGLWHWGHAMGVGFSRAQSQAEVITQLLPDDTARVTRNGIIFRTNVYSAPIIEEKQWSTRARSVKAAGISRLIIIQDLSLESGHLMNPKRHD